MPPPTATTIEAPAATPSATTSSRASRVIGAAALVGTVLTLLGAFVWSEPDRDQGEIVRLFYLHVPVASLTYAAFVLCGIGSALFLWKRSTWGDIVAHASARVGVLFGLLTLVTGAIWGRPTWGTYWDWGDVRLVSSLILVLLFAGYLALRSVPGDPVARGKQAAVVALVALIDIPIINRSVAWWGNRTLHQESTIIEGKIEDINAFTTFIAFVTGLLVLVWLIIHEFRLVWLARQIDDVGLDKALAERRAEATQGVSR